MEATSTNETRKKSAPKSRALGYMVLFIVSYFIFLILTFPFDILLGGAIKNFEAGLAPSMKPMSHGPMNIKLPLGVEVKDLEFGMTPSGHPRLQIDSIILKASLFSAIRGKISADWKASLYNGKMIGVYKGNAKAGKLNAKAADLQIEKIPMLLEVVKMNLAGKLSVTGDIDWSTVWQENKGKIVFSITEGVAKDVDLKIMKTDFVFTKIEGDLDIAGGIITVNRMILEGTPCGFEINGTIQINPGNFESSALDLTVIFSPDDELREKVPWAMLQPLPKKRFSGHLGGSFGTPVFP